MLQNPAAPTVLLLLAAAAWAAAASPPRLVVAIDPAAEAAGAVRDGVTLGLEEAERAAALLGRTLEVSRDEWPLSTLPSGTVGLVVAAPRAALDRLAREEIEAAVVAVAGRWMPSSTLSRWFVVEHQPGDGGRPIPAGCEAVRHEAWDASLRRYGAGQLNERFERRHGRPMTGAAWAGWVAVKALVEAVLRAPSSEPASIAGQLRVLRFDGHKGRALHFDDSQRLVHPSYAIASCGGETRVAESKQ